MLQGMVRRIRGWVRRPSRRFATADVAVVAAPVSAVPMGVPAPARTVPTPPPGERVAWAARETVRVRSAELLRRFGWGGDGDVRAVLAAVVEPGAVIRQPPTAAQEVLALCRRSYGLDEMRGLFEKDPAMSQALLRHANSAWYGGLSVERLLGLKAAIQRVGSKGVNATVMYHLLQGELSRPGPGLDGLVQQVWEHMVRTAPIARALAHAFRADPDEAFTLGLLHDVGKLVFFDRVAEERRRAKRDLRLPGGFVPGALTALHEPLGALAALEWGLDAESAVVIGSHHRRGDHPADGPLSETVYVAEAVDLAQERGRPLDLTLLWAEGELTGSQEAVEAWLAGAGAEFWRTRRAEKRRRALRR